jgi:hypothetical protein
VVSEEYLDYIRKQRCVVCGQTCVDPHHLKTVGAGGADFTAVPLCREHHDYAHKMGVSRFKNRYAIDLFEVALTLLIKWVMEV